MSEKYDGLDLYKITIDEEYSDGETSLGIDEIAFVSQPAVLTKGFAFKSDLVIKEYTFKDEVKMRIAAPVLIPMNIYRNDEMGEYYVQFSVEEIELMYKKFMMNLNNQNKFNLEHTEEKVPAYILESILADTQNKIDYIKTEYNIDLPMGSVLFVSQITDRKYYDNLITNEQYAFSIEGFLGFKLSDMINKKNKKNKMAENILPEGTKFQVLDKMYEVKDGVIVEVIAPVVAESDVKPEDEKPVELEGEKPVEEEKPEVPEVPAKMEDAPEVPEVPEAPVSTGSINEADLMVILQPKFDEINSMIAELKIAIDSVVPSTPEVPSELPVSLAVHRQNLMSSIQKTRKY
jgi:hypothetical protein